MSKYNLSLATPFWISIFCKLDGVFRILKFSAIFSLLYTFTMLFIRRWLEHEKCIFCVRFSIFYVGLPRTVAKFSRVASIGGIKTLKMQQIYVKGICVKYFAFTATTAVAMEPIFCSNALDESALVAPPAYSTVWQI